MDAVDDYITAVIISPILGRELINAQPEAD